MVRPGHVLAAVAFFLVVLVDTGRIPVETHSGTLEFGMIDEARTLEHSGAPLALLKWGSAMKQLVLYTILINVFVAPWGLASSGAPEAVVLAIPALLGKAMVLGMVFAVVDNLFSKLRLFKITEFIAAAFLLAVLAVLVFYVGGG
jgi:formate hydrogenlyase subunit 4